MYGGGEWGNERGRLVGEMTRDMTRDRYIGMYDTRQSHCYVHDMTRDRYIAYVSHKLQRSVSETNSLSDFSSLASLKVCVCVCVCVSSPPSLPIG